MRTYFILVIRHRLAVLGLVALISLAAAASVSQAVLASSVREMFFGEDPAFGRYIEHIERFGSDEVILVAYREADPLSPEALDRLEQITATIARDPEVKKVSSLLTLDRIRSNEDQLSVDTFAEVARRAPDSRAALVAEIQADPIIRGTFVGASGDLATVLIELTVDDRRSGEVGPRIVEDTLAAFAGHGYGPDKVHRAGFPAVVSEMVAQARYALSHLMPVVLGVLSIILTLLFRTPLPVALAVGVSGLSVLWSVGVAAAVDPTLSIFYGVIPPVVTVVAVSDVIHMWSAYLHELGLGRTKEDAILASAEDVGRACLLTSVTTFVGFVSISLIPTPVFQELGWVLGLGVAVALILAMTLVPIFATIGATPTVVQRDMDNPIAHLVDRIVRGSIRLSTGHPRAVIAGFGLFSILCLVTASQHRIETNFLERLSPDNVVRIDNAIFEAEFSGTQAIDIFISAETEGAMLTADTLAKIDRLERALEAHPSIDSVLSYADVLRSVHRHLGGDGPLPTSDATIAQEMLLFELAGGSTLEPVLNFERNETRMALRLSEHRMRAIHDIAKQSEVLGRQILGEDLEVEATGMMPLSGGWLDNIVKGQRNGVLASIGAITLLMIVGLRSVSVGLISLIPNLLPLLATTALTGLIWGDIDSDTLVILMMAIGIGVDDTIHFLMRYRIASARCEDPEEAIAQTFHFSGRAIVMTTVILAAGFSPMAMSSYYSMAIVGTLLPFALAVAMVADLLLVPALAAVGWLRYPSSAA